MDKSYRISVIICSYNRAAYIVDAVQSLFHQTLAKSEFEVLVVDNNSTDNTASLINDFIKEHPELNLRYFNESQQGASFARNKGAEKAVGRLLCFMDDDAIAEKNYLQKIVSFFDQYPQATALGGRIIPRYIPHKPSWMSYHVSSLVGNFDYSSTLCVFKPGKYPLESNMIVKRDAFQTIGGFNTALPGVKGTLRIGGEGKDFFLRLHANGGTTYYHPEVIVEHVVEVAKLTPEYMYRVASGIGRGERVRTKALGTWVFIKKLVEYIYKFCGSIVLGLFYAITGKPRQMMPVIQFRIDALKGLLGF